MAREGPQLRPGVFAESHVQLLKLCQESGGYRHARIFSAPQTGNLRKKLARGDMEQTKRCGWKDTMMVKENF